MIKKICAVLLLLSLAVPCFAVDISRDVLRDQYVVVGDIIDTGVLDGCGETVKIDTSVDRVVFTNWELLRG